MKDGDIFVDIRANMSENLRARQILEIYTRALLDNLSYCVVKGKVDSYLRLHEGELISKSNRLYLPMVESREYLGKKIVGILIEHKEDVPTAIIPVFLVPVVIDYAKLGYFNKTKLLYNWIITNFDLPIKERWVLIFSLGLLL